MKESFISKSPETHAKSPAEILDQNLSKRRGRIATLLGLSATAAGLAIYIGGEIANRPGFIDGGIIATAAGLALRVVGMIRASKSSK